VTARIPPVPGGPHLGSKETLLMVANALCVEDNAKTRARTATVRSLNQRITGASVSCDTGYLSRTNCELVEAKRHSPKKPIGAPAKKRIMRCYRRNRSRWMKQYHRRSMADAPSQRSDEPKAGTGPGRLVNSLGRTTRVRIGQPEPNSWKHER